MSTVDITTGSASGGGDQPPNDDPEYESDELAPIEDDDEQEAANENENPHRTTEQSLVDAVLASVEQCDQLQAELTAAMEKIESLRSQIKGKTIAHTNIRAKQSALNSEETKREAAQVADLRMKWSEMRMRCFNAPDTTLENKHAYEAVKKEYAREAKIALAAIERCTNEISTLTIEREDLQASLTIPEIMVTSLKRQLTEAETVRKERREELQIFRDVEQIEQQETVEAAQQQQLSTQEGDSLQSQQPSSYDDQVPQQQLLPTSHQQPPPPQFSGVQQQQQTPTAVTQQTDIPSTVDARNTKAGTSIQPVTLTEASVSRIEPMDQTLPNRGPPSSSNDPMSVDQSSESTSHDDEMKSANTSFERRQTNASLPPEQNYGGVLDNYPQYGFDPSVRSEAPSPAESAATLRYQHNLFRHNAESSAFHSAATSPYGSSNLNASTGPTDSSQPLYNEMLQLVQAAAAFAPDNGQQPANDERQNLATSAANIMDRLRLQPDGNLGWPAQQTPAQSQHPANMSSGQLPHAPPVSGYTAMGLQLQRQQSAPYLQHQQQQVTPQQHQQMVIQQQLQQQMPFQQQLLAVQQQQHQQLVSQQQRMSTPQLYQSSWLQQPSHYAVPEINPGQLHQQGMVPQLPQFQHSTPLHSRPTTPSQQFPQAPQGSYGNFAMPGMLPPHPSLPQQYPGQQLQPVQQQYAPQPQVMPQQHQAAPQHWNAHQQLAQLHQATPPQQVEPPYQVAPPIWNIPTTTV